MDLDVLVTLEADVWMFLDSGCEFRFLDAAS